MATPVEMPKLSDTMEEGVLVAWLAEEGDSVSAGDVIAQVETDKATMDLEVYDDGVLLKRVVEEGAGVPIGGLIAVLGDEGEDISELLSKYSEAGSKPSKSTKKDKKDDETDEKQAADESRSDSDKEPSDDKADESRDQPREQDAPPVSDGGRVKASPLARRMASEQGLDLESVVGTGPDGRVVKRDVESALGRPGAARTPERGKAERQERAPSRPQPATVRPEAGSKSVAISQMRKAIARRLAESKFTSPHFYLTLDVDMGRAVEARSRVNELVEARGQSKVSYNDFVTKACAVALRLHPAVNSSYLEKEGEIRQHGDVHVAVAVAVDEGLLTPVIRNADQKGLTQIAEETRSLADKARKRKLQPDEWEGSTFTTSNLGMFGIEEFTAIINPPNACILAIGAIREVPVIEEGEVRIGSRMKITLSCDHRIVDGATGAQFLADVKRFLEEPMNMLL